MTDLELIGLPAFLKSYPGMAVRPSRSGELMLEGDLDFSVQSENGPLITDSYKINILISEKFPWAIPVVRERGGKIPRDGRHHVHPDDTLCLGSPLRLLRKVHECPTIVGFVESCLTPYLYAFSRELQTGEKFYMGELVHGEDGVMDDYRSIFGLSEPRQIVDTITMLGLKRRIANKQQCPCGCRQKLRACSFRILVNDFRKMAPRSWFRRHSQTPGKRL